MSRLFIFQRGWGRRNNAGQGKLSPPISDKIQTLTGLLSPRIERLKFNLTIVRSGSRDLFFLVSLAVDYHYLIIVFVSESLVPVFV